MNQKKRIGVIFDMDGTLWDSAKTVAWSWEKTARECGYTDVRITESDIKGVMGLTMDVLAGKIFPNIQEEERALLLEKCGTYENQVLSEQGAEIYPNVRETFEALREAGYLVCIVSNCQSGYIEAFLKYYQLEHLVDDKACYGDNDQPKDVNIKLVMDRKQMDLGIYVGDIEGDYQSSKKAGAKFIRAAYGFGTISDPVPEISKLAELPKVVERVVSSFL